MKRKKKIAITSISALFVAAIVGMSCFVAFSNKPVSALSTYILRFDESASQNAKSKNEYISKMIERTRMVLDNYAKYYKKTYGKEFKGLTFDFVNLTVSQTDGEKNFFRLLNRSLKTIDPRLGFNNIQRTPVSVQEGYYQKNAEMLSFFWSPDFNSITTWLTYMFTDDFSVPNMWLKLYRILEDDSTAPEWAKSLKTWLEKKGYFVSPVEVLNYVLATAKGSQGVSQFYNDLANAIGVWVENNSSIKITPSSTQNDLDDKITYYGDGIKFINWLSSQIVNLPYVEDGPLSSIPVLLRKGYFIPTNPNTDTIYRDWYYNASDSNGKGEFKLWIAANPFDTNKTPFNPAFSNSPATTFSSAWTGLTTWTTIDEYNNIRSPSKPINPDATYLVSTGSKTHIDTLEKNYNSQEKSLTFKVRAIPWVDSTGTQIRDDNGQLAYLSPADFRASIIAFVRSIQININSNSYFLHLMSLDADKTVNDIKNKERNTSPTDEKEFKIYFTKDPDLSMKNIFDILQKQYFNAIPAFKESVKNIIDFNRFVKLIDATPKLDQNNKPIPDGFFSNEYKLNVKSSNIDFYNFYGSGNPVLNKSSFKDYAYAGPYYVSDINEQQIVFKLNKSYFDSFTSAETSLNEYKSFRLTDTIQPDPAKGNDEVNTIKRIDTIIVKYAGSYSETLTYEQFKSNELDLSTVTSAKLLEAKKMYPSDYRSYKLQKLNRSNLVGFNLNVFSKDGNGIILDSEEEPMVEKSSGVEKVTYDIDKFGNYVFANGKEPKVKSNVSREYYDLIVRDFYTPIEASEASLSDNDPSNDIYAASETIRQTIVNCINWVALKSVVFPGITKSIQYSFMPYGVYQIGNEADNKKYWWFAAYKPYMTTDELNHELNNDIIAKRKSGMILWTYDELNKSQIKRGGDGN